MTNQEARQRYFRVFIPAMAVFLVACLAIAWFDLKTAMPPVAVYAVAMVPIVALLSVFWAHWRFMQEVDEFLRSIQMKALVFGLAVVLAIATGWGFLESYADVPHLRIFWLNPVFWISYGVAATTLTWRTTGQFE